MKHIDPRFLNLETKAEGDDVDPVTAALEGFRASLDARLSAFETKSGTRMDSLEARLNRPAAGLETKAASMEAKALNTYLRRGPEHLGELERKALTVGSSQDGGYLATPEFGAELLKLLVQFSPVRAYAKKVTANGSSITYPRRKSSIIAYWTAEAAARTPSSPTFEQQTITPYSLTAEAIVSDELLEDNAYDLEGELLSEFAEQFGKVEGAAFVNGTGVGQPVGLLTSADPRILSYKTGSNDAGFPDIVLFLVKTFHTLPAPIAQNGAWMMNRNTLAGIREAKDGMGRPLVLDGLTQGMPTTLLGRPVIEAIDMPDATAGNCPVLFGDFSGYRIVDRIAPTIMRDPYTLLGTGQVRFVGRKRVGADVTHPDKFVKVMVGA